MIAPGFIHNIHSQIIVSIQNKWKKKYIPDIELNQYRMKYCNNYPIYTEKKLQIFTWNWLWLKSQQIAAIATIVVAHFHVVHFHIMTSHFAVVFFYFELWHRITFFSWKYLSELVQWRASDYIVPSIGGIVAHTKNKTEQAINAFNRGERVINRKLSESNTMESHS